MSAKNKTPDKANHSTDSVIHESPSKCEDSKKKRITCLESVTTLFRTRSMKHPKPAHFGLPGLEESATTLVRTRSMKHSKPAHSGGPVLEESATTLVRTRSMKHSKPAHSGGPVLDKMKRLSGSSFRTLPSRRRVSDLEQTPPKLHESVTTLVRTGSMKRPTPAHSGVPAPERMKRLSANFCTLHSEGLLSDFEQTSPKANHSTDSDIHGSSSKCEESKEKTCPESVTTLVRTGSMKRPKPGHSGVQAPEKMKRQSNSYF